MVERKYDYLFTSEILRGTIYPPFKNMLFFALGKGTSFEIRFTHVSVPFEGKEVPHKHDFDEVFLFVPCSEDLSDYDAESELYLGEEGEKYIIDKTTAVHIPAGLTHCPIIHKRVGKPFFFVNSPITRQYSAYIDGKKSDISVRPEDYNLPDMKP